MSAMKFTKSELAAAITRGARQCVLIGSRPALRDALESSADPLLRVFAVGEQPPADSQATFVPTQFAAEGLAAALERSDFDKLKASLFVWLGVAAYGTVEAVLEGLSFIASLLKGSGVLFDYAVERTAAGSLADTALDALASRISVASGSVKHLIRPQAVAAMLSGIGFRKIVDLATEECAGSWHLVSASI